MIEYFVKKGEFYTKIYTNIYYYQKKGNNK